MIKNAIIENANINLTKGFMITISLTLNYGDGGQIFAYDYCLYNTEKLYVGIAGHFLARIMKVAGVTNWKDVVGKAIRVDSTDTKVHGIGHITKDDWFYPDDDIEDAKTLKKTKQNRSIND